jgi:sulfite reductase (ferredoxin)
MLSPLLFALAVGGSHAAVTVSPRAAAPLASSRLARAGARAGAPSARMSAGADSGKPWMVEGQKFGPQHPGQPAVKPYTNLDKIGPVEAVKRDSGPAHAQLASPLKEEMMDVRARAPRGPRARERARESECEREEAGDAIGKRLASCTATCGQAVPSARGGHGSAPPCARARAPAAGKRQAPCNSPAHGPEHARTSATDPPPYPRRASAPSRSPFAPLVSALSSSFSPSPARSVALRSAPTLTLTLTLPSSQTETISISHDAVIVLKHHGSYQQQNREARGADKAASYQFMLRLKMPNGEVPPALYLELDKLADEHGQGDLRATTRQAFQLHGVLKHDLKEVIKRIANTGASTLGGCGDINRNVMTPAARLPSDPAYGYAKRYASALAELFKPMTGAFSELWLDGEKAITTEYWQRDLYDLSATVRTPADIDAVRVHDNGRGVLTGHATEPLYGTTYLPRKFKIGVTVPGDNSIDLFTNDLGLVVLMHADGQRVRGFNVYAGGGMGRTHNKESTFARVAEPLCFVEAEGMLELAKAVLAAQRDHGNREVRANARMKYLVHTLGIEQFRELVGSYYGQALKPVEPMAPWVAGVDWLGWHAQGDGKWFVGINVPQGRVVDGADGVRFKSAFRQIAQELQLTMLLTAGQNVAYQDVPDEKRAFVEEILKAHGIAPVDQVRMQAGGRGGQAAGEREGVGLSWVRGRACRVSRAQRSCARVASPLMHALTALESERSGGTALAARRRCLKSTRDSLRGGRAHACARWPASLPAPPPSRPRRRTASVANHAPLPPPPVHARSRPRRWTCSSVSRWPARRCRCAAWRRRRRSARCRQSTCACARACARPGCPTRPPSSRA